MKKIICTLLTLILLSVPTFAKIETRGELNSEKIKENFYDEIDYLNRFIGCSGPIHNPEDHVTIGQYDIFSPNAKFTSYSKTKAELFDFCSPYLAMVALGQFQHINVNDKIYTYDEFLAPFTEGGMPYYNNIEIISSNEDSTSFNYNYIVDGEILLSGIGEYVKINDEWKLNAIDGIVGQISSNRTYEDIKAEFARYAGRVIRSYIVSENQKCGYGKYLGEPSDSGSGKLVVGDVTDVVITEFNESDCTGSAYILINEYDRNQNIVATRTITAEIGKNLTEKVSTDAPENPNTCDYQIGYILLLVFATSGIGIISNKKHKNIN
ncbi:MAG: hypothetical protein E7481_07435 [Ruminococcaceae bacterium]|nr:hypothetical protein [Oscillospiraceae bacterium]